MQQLEELAQLIYYSMAGLRTRAVMRTTFVYAESNVFNTIKP
jgi:hypothetical protein